MTKPSDRYREVSMKTIASIKLIEVSPHNIRDLQIIRQNIAATVKVVLEGAPQENEEERLVLPLGERVML